MAKRTQKAGITGKYGTRYGGALRKIIKKFELQQHSKYVCPACGKTAVRRSAVGIWKCKGCKTTFAGGAYEFSTTVAVNAKTTMNRLKKLISDAKEAAQAPVQPVEEEKPQKRQRDERKPREPRGEGAPKRDGQQGERKRAERPAGATAERPQKK